MIIFRVGERRALAGRLDVGEGLGHAEQPELPELIEGGVGEHVASSMVVARAADVGVEDCHAVGGAGGRGLAIQIVVEDRLERAVGACADLESAGRGGLDPLPAERLDEPDDAEARPEALLGMRPMLQDELGLRGEEPHPFAGALAHLE